MLPYAHEMFRMLNAAFANTYSCVSINDSQIEVYTKQYFSFSRPDYPKLVLDKHGEAVGFVSTETNIELGGNLKVQKPLKILPCPAAQEVGHMLFPRKWESMDDFS